MWTSFGDGYNIVPHDNQKKPRKVKGTRFLALIFIVIWFLPVMLTITYFRNEPGFWQFVPASLMLLIAVVYSVFFLLKWIKNNHECDILLIITIVLCIVYSYLLSPYNTFCSILQLP
jgi:asparagine N-glycosylation enzyme membrane subunit Stt3